VIPIFHEAIGDSALRPGAKTFERDRVSLCVHPLSVMKALYADSLDVGEKFLVKRGVPLPLICPESLPGTFVKEKKRIIRN
jgi:hypothetical protein